MYHGDFVNIYQIIGMLSVADTAILFAYKLFQVNGEKT